jgi:hypothetical protein
LVGIRKDLGALRERKPSVSELDFFRRSRVPGYAADDGNVVINPVPEPGVNYEAVRLNEHIRQLIRKKAIPQPTFQLTPEQQQRFGNYGSPEDITATIAARIVSGDPSAGTVTPEQQMWVNQISEYLRGR